MSTVNQLSHSVRRATASATNSFARSHEQDDADTREYQRLIASLHEEWDRLESQANTSVMPKRHMMDAILAETRHGAQVEMPATDLGPYSMSEFSLRALIRRTVDGVPGARKGHRGLGVPQTISCRISAHLSVDSLPQLGQQVRDAVRAACHENLGVSPTVNVHIEDLHDDD